MADAVVKQFRGVRALDGVSLAVSEGEIVGLIGPNGAGKTSAIDAITGFARASGTVTLEGTEIHVADQLASAAELVLGPIGGTPAVVVRGAEYERSVREVFEPTLRRLKDEAAREGWLEPQAVYGFFPVAAEGNDVVVYDPEAYARDGARVQTARFHFPRQEGRERLCLADYFRPVESGQKDVVAFQAVTVGREADDLAEEAFIVLREALRRARKVGIGQLAMRGQEYVVAIKPCGRGILMETLRYADELNKALAEAVAEPGPRLIEVQM